MAGMRMSMRKIREVLRLTHELGLSVRQVREATGVGKTAVSEYVNRAKGDRDHVADPAGETRSF
jgi:predicted transcriptional regulator